MTFDLCDIRANRLHRTLKIVFQAPWKYFFRCSSCLVQYHTACLQRGIGKFVAIFVKNLSSMREGMVLRSMLVPRNLGNDIDIESSRFEGKNTEYLRLVTSRDDFLSHFLTGFNSASSLSKTFLTTSGVFNPSACSRNFSINSPFPSLSRRVPCNGSIK